MDTKDTSYSVCIHSAKIWKKYSNRRLKSKSAIFCFFCHASIWKISHSIMLEVFFSRYVLRDFLLVCFFTEGCTSSSVDENSASSSSLEICSRSSSVTPKLLISYFLGLKIGQWKTSLVLLDKAKTKFYETIFLKLNFSKTHLHTITCMSIGRVSQSYSNSSVIFDFWIMMTGSCLLFFPNKDSNNDLTDPTSDDISVYD